MQQILQEKVLPNITSLILNSFSILFGLAIMFCTGQAEATPMKDLIGKNIQYTISGEVVDSEGLPILGINVVEKGTSNGTMTDIDGLFSLEVDSEKAILVFSSIGFETQEIPVEGTQNIKVTMQTSVAGLDEVVVVGYGTSTKRDVTGAVASISDEEFNQGAITNPLQQISGKAPGVNINQVGSEPGSTPSVRIRGITSLIGGNDPLVVVNGVQGNMDLLNQIPPNEIQSVDILKDASATAVYGSRGAPGVIIVTTKKNKRGTSTLEYSSTASIDVLSNELDVLDANQWWEQAQRYGVPASANHGSSTDWYDILTQTGYTQNHTISFGAGTDTFNYRASVSAILQEGVVLNSNSDKYIARLSANQKALDERLDITLNINTGILETSNSVQSIGNAAFTSNLITNSYFLRPTDPVFDTDGSYYTDPNVFEYLNPYAVAQTTVDERENNNLFVSLNADLDVYKGITLGWFGSWRKTNNTVGFFLPVESTDANAINQNGFANISNSRQDEKLTNLSLSYENTFGEHKLNALALYEWQQQSYQGNYGQARGFFNNETTYNSLQSGDLSDVRSGDISSYKNDRSLVSFLGRLNYTLKDKYLLTLSYRRDGSSVFGENNKWGNFPAASVAWRIDEEDFMQNGIFNQLKLRAGYGITGNQQGLIPQQSLSLVSPGGITYFGGEQIRNFEISQNSNEDLKWERKKQTNIGVDFSLIDSRLSGSLDAYTATTDDLLFNYTVPQPPFPYNTVAANVGSIRNRGIELALNYDFIRNNDVTLSLGGNMSLLDNEVLNLSGSIEGVELNTDFVPWGTNSYLIEGQPVGTYSILQHEGIDGVGAEVVRDINGDGTIDQGVRSPDRQIEGLALPTYNFAINPRFRYKDFDFSMLWRGSGGNKIYNGLRRNLSLMESLGNANVLESAVDLDLFTSQYSSNLWLEDGDFVRLENVNAGYNWQLDTFKYIESVRFSITGNNLLLITDYSGIDPEINFSGGNGFGGDFGIYPRTTSVALGLQVTFK
ncbi:SusC/RagA family TonB-linked outer membrane protein [Zunongwangia endophytica]|uniref:SusC/RagA family TonB-linked outer membrane protein n=1 Tax=Zunongwangia endophytica TaxID=1808945 RepID=A0ABV8H5S9_9FLAO|nr:SusC/RagA family TonB-linked outer membrane protein [Zunongwangia endophytica]MDN3595970.1 SusC/RagA family TonB-linked outer membrane protein [Zunongwangia endophytica]